MEFYPFFPRPYYYTHYRNMQNRNYAVNNQANEQTYKTSQNSYSIQNKDRVQNLDNSKENESPIFEIFGIRLFFDDILIISLIFFLYNEGVRDNLLFISLILILLS